MPKPVGHFSFIENAGPNSALATLKHHLRSAGSVDVQVAFTTNSGLKLLLSRLRSVAVVGRVRFVTGLYQGCTEPAALATLLRMQKLYAGRFQVYLSTETNFHRKAFLIRSGSALHAVIGSSNLSENGLRSAGELNVLLTVPASTKKAKEIERVFEREVEAAKPLTKERLDRYEQIRKTSRMAAMSKSDLARILGPEAKHNQADGPARDGFNVGTIKYWVEGVGGYTAPPTNLVIAEETSWDRKGWSWRSCSRGGYERGHEVLLLDRSTRPAWAVFTRVMDTTQTPAPTPDGRDFVAYTVERRAGRKQLTPRFARELRKAGVRSDGGRALIGKRVWARVRGLFSRR